MSVILSNFVNISVSTLILAGVIGILHYFFKIWRYYYLAFKLPGPSAWPIIGNVLDFKDSECIMRNLFQYHEKFGKTVRVWMGPIFSVSLSDPRQIQLILNTFLEKDRRIYFKHFDFIEEGLIFLDVDLWKVHRKIINPAFNQKILDSYMDIFTQQSTILVKMLQNEIGKPEFDIYEYVDKCSLDLICETAMDTKVQAQTQSSELLNTLSRLYVVMVERVFRFWYHSDIIWFLSNRGREYLRLRKVVHHYTDTIIQNRKKKLEDEQATPKIKKVEEYTDDLVPLKKRKPFLDLLLEGEGNTFSEKELRHEIGTFVNTGTDTIAVSTSYALLCLGMYPEIQENIIKEIDEVFGKSDRPLTLDDLPRLVYVEQFLKESMRIYTPVPVIARRVNKEFDIGEYVLPTGTTCFLNLIMLHRNADIWPEPLKFNPDRFTPEENAKRHAYSFIPFSGGPRNCIGMRYAMMACKTILATVMRTYRVKTLSKPENLEFFHQVVMKPIGGFKVSVEKRV